MGASLTGWVFVPAKVRVQFSRSFPVRDPSAGGLRQAFQRHAGSHLETSGESLASRL